MDNTAVFAGPTGARSAPDEVWAKVRDDYLGGISAPECCRRHGVGMTALRKRAARDGWRREDQPWRAATVLDPEDEGAELEDEVFGDVDQIAPRRLGGLAWRRMARAILRGDAVAALRWRRVCQAMDQEEVEFQNWIADERLAELKLASLAAQDAEQAHDAHNAHDAHCDFPPGDTPGPRPGISGVSGLSG